MSNEEEKGRCGKWLYNKDEKDRTMGGERIGVWYGKGWGNDRITGKGRVGQRERADRAKGRERTESQEKKG